MDVVKRAGAVGATETLISDQSKTAPVNPRTVASVCRFEFPDIN
jgi:hypothetical protein